MKIIVIGAVAAGTSAAAKARRNNDKAEIVIYEKDQYISYSGCGLPYYIGGEVEEIDDLTPRDPVFFKKKYNVDIFTSHKVLNISTENKEITVKNLITNEEFKDTYHKLVIATGATPFVPNIKGIDLDHVFFLRNVKNAIGIKDYMEINKPKTAVIVGTGFIGFELLENLIHENIEVTIIEKADKITPNLDYDMAQFLENTLTKQGVKILKNTEVTEIENNHVIVSENKKISADMVIIATGVRPNVELAKKANINLGDTGAIAVNTKMETNIKDIFACGDCIETYSLITNKGVYRPLGSTANKTGRIAGDSLTGGKLTYKGNLSTGIFKIFQYTVATTGMTEEEAKKEGYNIEVCHNIKPNKPEYMGGKEMTIKAVADKETGRLLGVQIVGQEGVDKRIDVFATLITYKATVEELFHLDLAYAPPFSTTKDPIHYTGMILDNAISNNRPIITANNIESLGDVQIIDARSESDYIQKGHVLSAINIPHGKLRTEISNLDKNKTTITYCNKGVTGNAAQNILLGNGFKNVYNLSGGQKFYKESQESQENK
ncbi:MAG: FAD-dependent oxidoreductase [Anaerotignaceae bacterium]